MNTCIIKSYSKISSSSVEKVNYKYGFNKLYKLLTFNNQIFLAIS